MAEIGQSPHSKSRIFSVIPRPVEYLWSRSRWTNSAQNAFHSDRPSILLAKMPELFGKRTSYLMGHLRIGQLARSAGVDIEIILYFEKVGLVASPPRTGGGHRV